MTFVGILPHKRLAVAVSAAFFMFASDPAWETGRGFFDLKTEHDAKHFVLLF
jgi:hypothetical protein